MREEEKVYGEVYIEIEITSVVVNGPVSMQNKK